MDTLLSMKVFRQVVDAGSFVTAATRLQLSPAMVSKHVVHLENYLHARLLNRTTRKLSLTESGRAYYDQCVRVLNDLEEAEQAIGAASVTPRGALRVTSLISIGAARLAPMISEYTAKHPQVTVDLQLNDRIVDIVEEGYDLAIRAAAEFKSSTLVARQIALAQFVICAAPIYLKRYGHPKALADLKNHNCLIFAYSPDREEWVVNDSGERQAVTVSGNFVSNNGDALRTAAVAGSGIVNLPTDIIGDDLEAGRLLPLFPELKGQEFGIYAVYPSRRHLSAKVRTFVDFLAEKFARPFWSGANTSTPSVKAKAKKRL
ncbi:MAG: LysR family transcriptional regulator [Gammaproteobacteria bacterium]|nr:LysR family transcriptional regulator [Gammaproteobacteria bacterium]